MLGMQPLQLVEPGARQFDDPASRALVLRPGLHLGIRCRVEFEVARVQLDARQPSVKQLSNALVGLAHVFPVFCSERQCNQTPAPVHCRRADAS